MPAAAQSDPHAVADGLESSAEIGRQLRADLDDAVRQADALESEFAGLRADEDVIQEDRDAAAILLTHARERLADAQRAMGRLDAGMYGLCVQCNQPIGAARLTAIVGVERCVACQALR
jgi:RNA polymerase-binding transcription factor DksA